VDVTVTDSFLNTATTAVTFTVDSILPSVAVSSPADGTVTADATPTVSFTASDATSITVECGVDGGSFAACNSPHTYGTLSDGAHTLNVRATDQAGNVGVDNVPITVDSAVPSINITSPAAGSATADNTPAVSFSVSDLTTTTTECRVDAGGWSACSSPYTTTSLADGSHTVDVRATDQAGNVATASRTFTVDTVLPDVNGWSPGNGAFTADATPTFSFNVDDATATTKQCSVDGGAYTACSSPFTTATLADGAHTLNVRATDAAGNIGSGAIGFTVDTATPGITISSPTAGSATADNTPAVSFSVSDLTATTTECRVDGAAYTACGSPHTTTSLADGSHTVDVRATDQAGNVATASRTFTVDTVLPDVNGWSPGNGSFTADATPTFSFNVDDATATTKECRIDGGAYTACSSPYTAASLADGAHTLTVRATDAAGNIGSGAIGFTVDTATPSINISSPQGGSFTSDSTPSVSFTVTDATATTLRCRVDGGAWSACSSPQTTGVLADGSHTVEVEATDQASNVGIAGVTFTVDATAPSVSITSPTGGATTGDDTPDIVFTATDVTALTLECRVDGGAYASCSSPFTAPTLADGPHTADVRATDAAGNATTDSVNFTVDSGLPTVDITSPTDGAALTNSSPDIVFTATDGGPITVECREDGGSWTVCSSPYTTTSLSQGPHTVDVRATDLSFNVVTDSVSFTVDSNPPVVSITSPNDFDTLSDATPEIVFTVTDITATTVECNVDGNGWLGCASPYTTPALTDGSHFVAVRATDAAGSIGSTLVNFTIDANPPVVTITSPTAGSATSDTTPDVSFTATDAGPVTTECRVDGGVFAACSSPFAVPSLTEGLHTVYVRATDTSSNQTTSSVSFYVDATSPSVSIASPANGSLTGDATSDVSFAVSDLTATTTDCRVDSGAFASCSSVWTTPALVDGSHTLTVRATDAAGNVGTAGVTITVDATSPSVSIGSPANGSVTADDTPSMSFGVGDASATTEECRVDGGVWLPCASPYTPLPLTDGSHTLSVRSTDAAGNVGSASVALTIDTTAPVILITAPLGGSTIGDPTPDVSFTVTDITSVTRECRVDGAPFGACASPWTAPSLTDGLHTADVRATDAAGNVATLGVTFTVDTTLPSASIGSPANGVTTSDNTPSVSFSITGTPTLTTECRVDGGAFATCSSPWATPTLADGSHTLAVRVTDGLARTASASVTINVDATAPTVTIAAPANGGATSSVTPAATFTATDASALTVECSVDGGLFSVCSSPYALPTLIEGPHALQVRATDAAGNQTTTTSNFDVDLTTPVVTIASPTAGATVTTGTPSVSFAATDATTVTFECSIDGGAYTACASPFTTPSLANATHTVSVRGTDAAGNLATASVSFTVDAPLPPPPAAPPAAPDLLPAAANIRARRSGRKIGFTFRVYLPQNTNANCDAPVLFRAKFSNKTVRLRKTLTGAGPLCQISASVKIPRGAKGRARINAQYFGNTLVDEVDADTSVRVK
jgi:hypothetical protein